MHEPEHPNHALAKKRATRIGVMLYSTGIVLPIHE